MSMSLDAMFAKEFKAMSMQLKAGYSGFDLYNSLPIPQQMFKESNPNRVVLINGIHDEYYGKLNKQEHIYWARPNLKRRKFNIDGFITDSNGRVVREDVPLTHGCAAILSKVKVGVPFSYAPKEDFQYVDCTISQQTKELYYIYIIPKKYCYPVNQAALVISLRRLRAFYYGLELVTRFGHTVYAYVVPYKQAKKDSGYRVLCVKTNVNFSAEVDLLVQTWLANGVLYSYEETQLSEPVGDRTNVAYKTLESNLDEFVSFDKNRTLETNTEELIGYDLEDADSI